DVPELPVDQPQLASTVANGAASSSRRWNLGVVVAPSLTSEKVNVGGGLAVAYQLSDKFTVGSGVSIGRLGVGENPNYDPRYGGSQYNGPPASPNDGSGELALAKDPEQYKRDVSVTSSVVALDIPLNLRYEVIRGFYTSVGVSYVAVLNE